MVSLKQAHPGEPWLWRADWAAGEIHSSAKPGALGASLLAILWNLIAIPTAVPAVLAHDLHREPKFAWFAIFPLIGIALIGFAIHLLLRWRAYGSSRFQMTAVPGRIGGTLEGAIHVERGMRPLRRVTLKLACINRVISGSGSNRSTSEQVLWSDEAEVAAGGDGAIPVAFLIPPEGRPTDDSNLSDRIDWQLRARSPGGAVGYKANFPVPIFRGAATPAEAADADALRVRREQRVQEFRPQGSAITAAFTGDGRSRIHFRAFRNPAVVFVLLGFVAVWSGSTYVIFKEHAPLIFRILWPAFEAIFAIWLIAMMFGSTTVLAGNGELTVVRRLFGLPVSTRRIASGEVREVRSITGMSAGATAYRRIEVRYGRDGQLNFGDGIRDPIEADWIATKIGAALGIAPAAIAPAPAASRRAAPN